MKRFSEQFNKQSKSVSLQAIERDVLRSRVKAYMEYHPLPAGVRKVAPVGVTIPGYRIVRLPVSLLTKWSVGVAAMLLVVVPFLAERSVPGDNLYAIKVQFNEEVISTLTLSPYKKVEWETERLNRRIAEARLLASEGKLTGEVETEIAAAVREHTDTVQREIAELRESDVDQATLATIELNTTLTMQSTALQAEGETSLALALADASFEHPTQMLVDVINESISEQESQMSSSSIPAYDKIMARVEMNTTRAYEILQALHLTSENPLQHDIERRLDDVNRSLEQANNLRGTNENQARQQLVGVLQRTQKLIVFMSGMEVGTVSNLESVVPVVLTEDEQKQRLELLTLEISRKSEILSSVQPLLSSGLSEKVSYALDITASNQVFIASSTEVTSSVQLAEDTIAALDDVTTLVVNEGVSLTQPVVPVTEEIVAADVSTSTSTDTVDTAITE